MQSKALRIRPAMAALVVFITLAASPAFADKLVIRFEDGSTETVDLTRPYKSIEVVRDAPPPAPPKSEAAKDESYVRVPVDAVNRGQTLEVSYLVTRPLTPTAWLGIVPTGIPHETAYESDKVDVLYVYLKGRASGAMTIQIPTNIPQGEYEIRIYDSDGNGAEVATSPPFYIY